MCAAIGEGHGDVVVELGVEIGLAEIAMMMVMDPVQAAEAFGDAPAQRAQEHPVHLEQSLRGGVEEQVDGLGLGHALVGGEFDRIDPKQVFVRAGADQRLEP